MIYRASDSVCCLALNHPAKIKFTLCLLLFVSILMVSRTFFERVVAGIITETCRTSHADHEMNDSRLIQLSWELLQSGSVISHHSKVLKILGLPQLWGTPAPTSIMVSLRCRTHKARQGLDSQHEEGNKAQSADYTGCAP